MPQRACICDYQVSVRAKARFWLLTHAKEFYKPTNTGRLIVDTIQHSEVFSWKRTEPDLQFVSQLNDPSFDPYIVFPEGESYQHRMVEFEEKPGREPVFIILDGTWRQARRMFRKSPYLADLPVLPLKTDRLTRYALRKPASEQHLCTVEVGIELLKQAGETQAAEAVEGYFEAFNRRYAEARGLRDEVLERINRV